jgi:hypothetical protein
MNGLCSDCHRRVAVTNDGRLCAGCLQARLNAMTPRPHTPRTRPSDDAEDGSVEDNPWQQNAVRAMEDQ